ncbi:hypothetical protein [Nostoc sp. C052]|uniref:hypothetical protein n=1 Tax=Nostoc sp. C052 TaxID=2576902 RepID=UPI0021187351|nr:hypothetical protein [Nostoc sp. C052]
MPILNDVYYQNKLSGLVAIDFISIIQHWLKDPTVEKLIQVCIAILVITLIVRALSNSVPRYIQDNDTRYHLRKTINFIGYGLIFLFAASIFSDNFTYTRL